MGKIENEYTPETDENEQLYVGIMKEGISGAPTYGVFNFMRDNGNKDLHFYMGEIFFSVYLGHRCSGFQGKRPKIHNGIPQEVFESREIPYQDSIEPIPEAELKKIAAHHDKGLERKILEWLLSAETSSKNP